MSWPILAAEPPFPSKFIGDIHQRHPTIRTCGPRGATRLMSGPVCSHPSHHWVSSQERTSAMKLYYNPLSTYSQKVMIAFNEKGIAYTPEFVDLGSPEARAAFGKISPLGKVPFLKPSEDWQVPESTSIIEYLEDKFPDRRRLIPHGGGDAARQVRFMDRMSDLYYNDPVTE